MRLRATASFRGECPRILNIGGKLDVLTKDLTPGQKEDVQGWINQIETWDPYCQGARNLLQTMLDEGAFKIHEGHDAVLAWDGNHPDHDPMEVRLKESAFWGNDPAQGGREAWALAHEGLHGYMHEHDEAVIAEYDENCAEL